MTTLRALTVVLAAAFVGGCGLLRPPAPAHDTRPPLQENPMFVAVVDRELVWNQLVDTVDNHFRIEREARVRLVGGVLTEGRIETLPQPGSSLLEPWRSDSTGGFEVLHSTLQSTRRKADIRVIPTRGGYLVEVLVFKELEDLSQPENATAGGSVLRHDGSLVRQTPAVDLGPSQLGWIRLGRDIPLEQRILAEFHARVTDPLPAADHP